MNKRAGMEDGIFFIVIFLALAIVFVVGNFIITAVNDEFQASDQISDTGKEITANLTARYVGVIDGAFLAFFVGIVIALTIGAFFTRTHPALFWMAIPILAFFVFIGAIYGNFFENFIQNDQIASSVADFTMMTFIMNNYVYFIMGAIILISIALFAKNRVGNIQ